MLESFEGQGTPPLSIPTIMHLQAWPEAVHGNAKKYIRPPYTPHQDWIDAMAIMQPWYDIYAEEMILKRDEWIPRLRDDMGMDAIIFIPAPGDIAPNYDMQVYKNTIADYHAAGMKVLMYWSIMHIGHHDAWHEAAKAHPEWAQRDADGNPVTVYGDLWMCPNTGALDFCIDLGIKLMVEMDCDGIMLDNNEFFMTDAKLPTGCCEGCQAAFAEWVKKNITAPELKALGHAGDVSCPRRGEPLYKHWREWRYETWAEATEKFRQAVRKAKPEAILTANTQYMGGWSPAIHRQFNSVDYIFTENKNRFGPNMAMTLKYARSLAPDIPIWNYIGAWEQSSRSHLRPAGMIEDQICATYASASSLWLTGYGFVPKSNISHWLAINYSTPADHSKAVIDPPFTS